MVGAPPIHRRRGARPGRASRTTRKKHDHGPTAYQEGCRQDHDLAGQEDRQEDRQEAAAKKSTRRPAGGDPATEPVQQPDGELPAGELEVRTALVSGTTFTDIPVQYVERDGYGVFEGDIILGSAEDLRAGLAATSESATDTGQGLHVGVTPGTRVDAPPRR